MLEQYLFWRLFHWMRQISEWAGQMVVAKAKVHAIRSGRWTHNMLQYTEASPRVRFFSAINIGIVIGQWVDLLITVNNQKHKYHFLFEVSVLISWIAVLRLLWNTAVHCILKAFVRLCEVGLYITLVHICHALCEFSKLEYMKLW